jgi:Tfp pilus assembly protein PilP
MSKNSQLAEKEIEKMPYITIKQLPVYHQISLDDILGGEVDVKKYIIQNTTSTRTYFVKEINKKFLEHFDIDAMVGLLKNFNTKYANLIDTDKKELYNTFRIPKKAEAYEE